MPSPFSRLRIAILGVGNIGSAFAFQLAETGGHAVTAVARPGSVRLGQLERDGAIVNVHGERAAVRVLDRLDEETPYDLLIVTVLAHQVGPLLPVLRRSSADSIQFMFNTFEPDGLLEQIGPERCAFGMPFIQATLNDDGRLSAAIGANGQKSLLDQQRWVDAFNTAGLPAQLEPNMPLWLRCHAPFCVAFESVSVAGLRRGGGASWEEATILARGVHASFALIKGLGYPIYPQSKRRIAGSPAWVLATMLWCMSRIRSFRELLATGEGECRALVDAMVEAVPRSATPISVSDIVTMKPV